MSAAVDLARERSDAAAIDAMFMSIAEEQRFDWNQDLAWDDMTSVLDALYAKEDRYEAATGVFDEVTETMTDQQIGEQVRLWIEYQGNRYAHQQLEAEREESY